MDKVEESLSDVVQKNADDKEHVSTPEEEIQPQFSAAVNSPRVQISDDCLIERQNGPSSSMDEAGIESVNSSDLKTKSAIDLFEERISCTATNNTLDSSDKSTHTYYMNILSKGNKSDSLLSKEENELPSEGMSEKPVEMRFEECLDGNKRCTVSVASAKLPTRTSLGDTVSAGVMEFTAHVSESESHNQKVVGASVNLAAGDYTQEEGISENDKNAIESKIGGVFSVSDSNPNEILISGKSIEVEHNTQAACCTVNDKLANQSINKECECTISLSASNSNSTGSNELPISLNSSQVGDSAQEENISQNLNAAHENKNTGMCSVPHEMVHILRVSHRNEVLTVTSDESSKNPLNHDYRNSSDSSETDLSSSSEDESVTEITDFDESHHKVTRKHESICRGEFLLSDLPPIEDLTISVPEEECIKIGVISSLVGELAVVQSLPNIPALDLGSVLFLNHGKTSLGKIFDVLGQVKEPFYTVRFNSELHALERGVTVGADVYCAPKSDHTAYVFVSEMMKMKGSDASWEHNNEPPAICLDYSDDEEERRARRTLTNQKHGDDKDNGPPKKKRGIRPKMGNSNHFGGSNRRENFAHNVRSEVSTVRGCFPQSIPQPTTCPPIFPPRPMYSPVHSRTVPPPCNPSMMFGAPPPSFSQPLRTAYHSSLFEAPPRNFPPAVAPRMPPPLPHSMATPPPYIIRPFHVLPPVPLIPMSPVPPIPSYASSTHVRPLLCPSRFQPHMDDNNRPGNI